MFIHRLKLRAPQLSSKWIDRPNLERRIAAANVAAIIAGPGYGKTVLAARAYHARSDPKLWYGLDAGDADIAVCAAHLASGLAGIGGASLPEGVWRSGTAAEAGRRFAETLGEVPGTIVFDDVHVLGGSATLAFLVEFVERASRAGWTFVLTGRTLPIELHALASRVGLVTVGASELAFSDDDARRLFAPDDARTLATRARLIRRAEGWVAGLTLLANGAQQTGLASTPADDETRTALFGYLAAEALANLSERERDFLLATSVLDELTVVACESIADCDDAAEILPSLARRGIFVVRRTDDAFTVHQLFREFLRDELSRTRPRGFVAELHRRAARALRAEGDSVGEIEHLLAAGEIERAAERLEVAAFGLIANGQLSRVDAMLARVPPGRIDESPVLLTARGRCEQLRGDWDLALASLQRAILEARAANAPDVMAEAVRVSSTILASRGEFDVLQGLLTETLALDGLGEGSRTALEMTLGAVLLERGRFDDALATFDAIMPALTARGDLGLQGMVLHNTGCALARRGDPYAALAIYERAIRVKQSAGQRVSTLLTLGNKIFMLRVIGDYEEAEKLTRAMLDESYETKNAAMIAHAHENEGALLLIRGRPVEALAAFRVGEASSDPGDVMFLPDIVLGQAQALLAMGDAHEADTLARRVAETLRDVGRLQQLAAVLATRAACAAAASELDRALDFAHESIELAPKGADTVAAASTLLDAGAVAIDVAERTDGALAARARALASNAASAAFAIVHEREYRFLSRTKAEAFRKLGAGTRGLADVPSPTRTVRNPGGDAGAPLALRVEMLGGMRVLISGTAVPEGAWKRRRARDLFAYLIRAGATKPVPRARLIDLFWPDADADSAAESLRVTMSAIRKAVGDVVKFEGHGYRFVAPAGTIVDADLFEGRIEAARDARNAGDESSVRRAYAEAADAYAGDFLDGYDDGDWQWRDRERLRAAAAEALRWIAHDDGSTPAARRRALDRLLEIAPYDVEALRARLSALVDEGRAGDADLEYASWRRRYRIVVGNEAPEIWKVSA